METHGRVLRGSAAVALLVGAVTAMVLGPPGGGIAAAPEPPAAPAPAAGKQPAAAAAGTLIRGASIIDGTGAPARRADVRLEGDRIAALGALEPRAGETVVGAQGLTLAPGFIDTHSHADDDLFTHPDALAALSQGITTVVVGQDGGAPFPLAEFFGRLEQTPAAINVAAYAGHGTLRRRVMGDDFRRAATPAEVAAMERLLKEEMRAGALGLSTGLEYDPGIYSAPDEVVRLAVVSRKHGGRYISHIRSEDRTFWKAVDEIIDIGRRARIPVQISHTKLAMKTHWGKADRLIDTLDRARREGVEITGDIYPYLYWQSTLTVLFPERNFEDLEVAALVLEEIAPPDGLLLTDFDPEPSYVGRTVAEIAALRGEAPPKTLVELIRASEALAKTTGGDTESVIGTSMQEADLERLMRWPHMNFCTDGSLDGSHPRGFGSYPRILGRYVRERRILTLEEAVHRASGLAARHMGFEDRGFVRPGMKADLVLFDPATIIDHATPQAPHAVSDGVRRVWVNGAAVFDAGRTAAGRPGRVLRRGGR